MAESGRPWNSGAVFGSMKPLEVIQGELNVFFPLNSVELGSNLHGCCRSPSETLRFPNHAVKRRQLILHLLTVAGILSHEGLLVFHNYNVSTAD